MNVTVISIGTLLAVGGTVFTASKLLVTKEDLLLSQNTQDYIRYEQEIEVIDDQIRDIKYEDDELTPKDREKIDELEARKERYRARQEKK